MARLVVDSIRRWLDWKVVANTTHFRRARRALHSSNCGWEGFEELVLLFFTLPRSMAFLLRML